MKCVKCNCELLVGENNICVECLEEERLELDELKTWYSQIEWRESLEVQNNDHYLRDSLK